MLGNGTKNATRRQTQSDEIAVRTRQCRVPTGNLYSTQLRNAMDYNRDLLWVLVVC
jgi:hypothetical protein